MLHDIFVKARGGSKRRAVGSGQKAESSGWQALLPQSPAPSLETFSFAPLGLPRTRGFLDPGLAELSSFGPPGLCPRAPEPESLLSAPGMVFVHSPIRL